MNIRWCLLVGLYIVIGMGTVRGQASSCAEVLVSAREKFDAGHLYGIPAQLKACLDKGFNRDQKIQAYRLLTRTYLLIDDPISAEDSYLKLLTLDPEYSIDPDIDPVDLVYLSKKFKTTPIFILYLKAGANLSNVDVIHDFGTGNTLLLDKKYSIKAGVQFGGGAELNVGEYLSLGVEGLFSTKTYKYEATLFGEDPQTYNDTQVGIDLPFYLKIRRDFEKLRPYVYGGVNMSVLMRSSLSPSLIDKVLTADNETSEVPVTGPTLSFTSQRNRITKSLLFGVGLNYRIGYNYISFDLRYMPGLDNFVNIDNHYENDEALYRYGIVEDYKRLNNYAFSVGYVYPLYKPRKIKKPIHFIKGIFSNKDSKEE